MTVTYVLPSTHLEKFYAFREAESKARTELSPELIKTIRAESLSMHSELPFMSIDEGVAKIKIEGLLEQTVSVSSILSGGATAYEDIEKATLEADANPSVREIQYHISSPGGNWDGVDYCAEVIASAKKPTAVYVYTEAQSGGYYLASQADKVYAVTKGSLFGSIGVACEVFDRTEEDGRKGVRRLVFTNSESADKRPDLLTDEGAAVMRDHLDQLYAIFEGRVVEGRRKNAEKYRGFFRENREGIKGAFRYGGKSPCFGADRRHTDRRRSAG
jgi:protease-4